MEFEMSTRFVIDKKNGFKPVFSHLVSMMNYTRYTTLEAVKGLSVEELDFLIHRDANSIGMLLGHMAAVERIYQIICFEDREPTHEEEQELIAGLELGERGRRVFKGFPLEFYLDTLQEVRNDTYKKFQSLTDDWLFKQALFWSNQHANNYFKWFHVFEDELNHRGQIRLIKKIFASERQKLEE